MNNKGHKFEYYVEKSLKEISKDSLFLKSNAKYNTIIKKYTALAFCDFVGIYKGKFILIECKTTSKSFFEFRKITKNQYKQLEKIFILNGVSIILICHYFSDNLSSNKYYVLDFKTLQELIMQNKKTISLYDDLDYLEQITINDNLMLNFYSIFNKYTEY